MKYKAKAGYKDLKDKFFQLGTQTTLLRGGTVELADANYKIIPKNVQKCLEPVDKEKKKPKAKKKRGK